MTGSLREDLQAALGTTYIIDRELADAGMARVFVATETALERTVVLKVLSPEFAAQLNVERFRREIQVTARLVHPSIVPLLSAGEAGGFFYYAMPFIEGESLRTQLTRAGELPVSEAIAIMRDLAKALSYAHERGVVHRDIKPENVLLSAGGALLTDFGIATALHAATAGRDDQTSTGIAFGTPAYMAPEQAAADPQADHRADLYALGVVAYEMLVGHPPFADRPAQATLAAQAIERPRSITDQRPAVPDRVTALVMQLLEKRPADRPQSADEVLRSLAAVELQNAIDGGTRPSRSHSRRPVVVAIVVAAALLAAAPALLRMDSRSQTASSPRDLPATRAQSLPIHSVAVLPFAVVGRDTAAQTFADGLADDLTSGIGEVPGFRVASRASAYALDTRTVSAGEIGQRLGVEGFLEGTVERAGERLRVTLQLTGTRDGLARWSATYEYLGNDRFGAQDAIVAAVVRALASTDTAGIRMNAHHDS